MKVAAVDFDGTLNAGGWMGKQGVYGKPVQHSVRGMKRLKELGYSIIIWTARGGEDSQIVQWLDTWGIPFDTINQPIDEEDYLFPGFQRSPKVLADVYIDDRGVGWRGWRKAMSYIENNN